MVQTAEALGVRVEVETGEVEEHEQVAVADVEEEVGRALVVAVLEELGEREFEQPLVEARSSAARRELRRATWWIPRADGSGRSALGLEEARPGAAAHSSVRSRASSPCLAVAAVALSALGRRLVVPVVSSPAIGHLRVVLLAIMAQTGGPDRPPYQAYASGAGPPGPGKISSSASGRPVQLELERAQASRRAARGCAADDRRGDPGLRSSQASATSAGSSPSSAQSAS